MIGVASLGAGYFSQFHLDGWRRIANVAQLGIHDRNSAKAEATGLPVFETLSGMLTETTPDLLDIVLPPIAHAEAIRVGLDHGVKTIICQKPFCTSLDEARDVTAAAERVGAALIVHENIRFQPWYRRIKASMDAGEIGNPLQASFRLRPGDGQGPNAYLDRQPYFQQMERFLVHETAVHWIDTFCFLFGTPHAVYADLRRVNPVIKGEDAGIILFDHPDGVRTQFDGNRSLDHAAENTRRTMGEGLFEGTEGTLTLRGDGSVQLRHFGNRTPHEILPPDTSQAFGGDCAHHLQTHVVDALTDGTPIENSAQDYLAVLEIEQAVYAAAQSGQKTRLDI